MNGATANTNVGIGTTSPAATLDVHGTGNFTGLITFASGQTFPGTGTITGVTPGTDLTGGGNTGNVTLNVDTTKVVTEVVAGTDLTGGGTGGVQTLNLDTTKVPQLNTANTFTGNQTVNGNLGATGIVTGNSFQIGSNLFAFGNYANGNAFLGFAGNTTTTGTLNTASGSGALFGNTSGTWNTANGFVALYTNTAGYSNTASGAKALFLNTGGYQNTASGYSALYSNSTGAQNTASGVFALQNNISGNGNTAGGVDALSSNSSGNNNTADGYGALDLNTGDANGNGSGNTASGVNALSSNTTGNLNTGTGIYAGFTADATNVTGSNNTFLGAYTTLSTGTLTNATAIGANAKVAENNALVLGSISGVNSANASTTVGIGITAPTYLLHIGNTGGANYNQFLRVEGPTQLNSGTWATSFGGYGNFGIDYPGSPGGRFYVLENGAVGIGCHTGCLSKILALGQGLGPAIADGWQQYSSRRWKTNIHPLQGALSKVEELRGVSYDLKQSGKHEIGVIAEEVGKVVPEVVSYEQNGKDAQGVDYSRLTALLIEAVKEQQREISSQRAQISRLRDQDTRQAHALQNLTTQMTILQSKLAQLDGNLSGARQAKTASAGTTTGQTVVAKAQF